MMVDAKAAIWATEHLTPRDFFREAHTVLFEAMLALVDERIEIDFVTLHDYCRRRHLIDSVGGPAYVAGLSDGVPRTTNIRYYAGILIEERIRRDLMAASDAIVAEVLAGDLKGSQLIDQMDAKLLTIARPAGEADLIPEDARGSVLFDDLQRRFERQGALYGLSTGLRVWDEMTGGLHGGDLTIIAARPSVGKTALATNVMLHAARAWKAAESKKLVAFFSLEMSRLQVEYRLLSSMSKVMLFRILNGLFTEYEQQALSLSLAELLTLPLAIDDTASLTVESVRAKCRRLQATRGLGLVIVDYVQLMQGSGIAKADRGNRNVELTHISRRLKMLGKELDVPVVILSQLSRAPEGREDKRPRMSDLRESGALEQDADNVVILHRPNPFEAGPGGVGELILEKQRNGPTAVLDIFFEKERVFFRDVLPGEKDALAPVVEPSSKKPQKARRPGVQPAPTFDEFA